VSLIRCLFLRCTLADHRENLSGVDGKTIPEFVARLILTC